MQNMFITRKTEALFIFLNLVAFYFLGEAASPFPSLRRVQGFILQVWILQTCLIQVKQITCTTVKDAATLVYFKSRHCKKNKKKTNKTKHTHITHLDSYPPTQQPLPYTSNEMVRYKKSKQKKFLCITHLRKLTKNK